MARPKTKEQLISLAEENFRKLFVLINSMNKEEQEQLFAFEDRDKNLRDVFTHLFEWHYLCVKWINSNQNGEKSHFLPAPYTWKTYPEMNGKFWEKHQETSLEKAISVLNESHLKIMNLINTFSDEELFTKKYFSWTGTTSLGSYCISSTSSHYDWATKKIKKHKKQLKQ